MKDSAKHVVAAGIALVSVGAIAVAPSVQPPAPPPRSVQLSAAVQRLAPRLEPITFIVDLAARIVIPPSLGAPVPAPPTVIIAAPTSVGSTIKNVYNAVEPYVRYGFDLAAYAVGFVPYVGWLAPQITIFYNFGERIARSITFNIADFLDGHVSFGQGLVNVGVDTVNSFVQLGIDELHFFLPSLPPLPPLPLAVTQTPLTALPTAAPSSQPTVSATRGPHGVADLLRVPPRIIPLPTGSATVTAATPTAAASAAASVGVAGRESRSGATSVVGIIKSVMQKVLSTPASAGPEPDTTSAAATKGPQTRGPHVDGHATTTRSTRPTGSTTHSPHQ